MKKNMKQVMRSLSMMIAFFTRIPMKYGHEFDEDDYCIGIMFLPVVGLIISLGLFSLKYALFFASPYVSGLIMLIFYIWITGGLHIDGLADTFDGIFSGRDRERMFEIMKDSRVGSFGAVSICGKHIGSYINDGRSWKELCYGIGFHFRLCQGRNGSWNHVCRKLQ
jgi:adenosylcobinamide-GDP ribazoletransferase